MPAEGTATSMAIRVTDAIEPVLVSFKFGPGRTSELDGGRWSVMFSAPYDGVADRFPGSPYEPGELADDEHADLYVIGHADDGVTGVEFEGAPLVELLRDAGLEGQADQLEGAMRSKLDVTLDALNVALRAFFD